MQKRPLLSLRLLACLVAAFVGMLWLIGLERGISESSFDRIKGGMTEKEVVEIIGVPPGQYSSPYWYQTEGFESGGRVDYSANNKGAPSSGHWLVEKDIVKTTRVWGAKNIRISLYFDKDDKVVGKYLVVARKRALSDKLSRWLGLPWW